MTKLNSQIKADPANINILPGYSDDPRIVENLLNGVNRTRDDFNMWLAPFEAGKEHSITVTFKSSTRLALFRLWNYNKSRWVRTRMKSHIRIRNRMFSLIYRPNQEIKRHCLLKVSNVT